MAAAGVAGKPVVAPAALALCVASCGSGTAPVQSGMQAKVASELAITGYGGIAMEPFVSRDGRFLLFTTRTIRARTPTCISPAASTTCAGRTAVWCRNFDVDIDASGTVLTFVDSRFGGNGLPQDAVLVMARWNGTQFVRSVDSATILAAVNAGTALQYAPALSADHLTLWFTRLASASGRDLPQIWRARRASEAMPSTHRCGSTASATSSRRRR